MWRTSLQREASNDNILPISEAVLRFRSNNKRSFQKNSDNTCGSAWDATDPMNIVDARFIGS